MKSFCLIRAHGGAEKPINSCWELISVYNSDPILQEVLSDPLKRDTLMELQNNPVIAELIANGKLEHLINLNKRMTPGLRSGLSKMLDAAKRIGFIS